ncbi:hypothetical protein HK104_008711 [Borealophlyctis nickersoniae]|nr:hypothetical protein HK104_008711 [Borealophlyctis nickersoniae]
MLNIAAPADGYPALPIPISSSAPSSFLTEFSKFIVTNTPAAFIKDTVAGSPPSTPPGSLRSRRSVSDLTSGRRTPSPCPGHRSRQYRKTPHEPTPRTLRPAIIRASKQSTTTPSSVPQKKKSLSFHVKIERVCLFKRGSLPTDISGSEKYDVEDSGDLEAGSVSASQKVGDQLWALASSTVPPVSTFGTGMVVLDHARLEGGQVLAGSVLVRNIAFEKRVVVRVSSDMWRTYKDVEAGFGESVSGSFGASAGVDRFRFGVDLNEDLELGDGGIAKIQFAVQYTVGGVEHWDNNAGQNYEVQVRRVVRQNTRPVPIKMKNQNVARTQGWDDAGRSGVRGRSVSYSTTPLPSAPISLPLTPAQRRESRRAVALSKSTFTSDWTNQSAPSPIPIPTSKAPSADAIEVPLSISSYLSRTVAPPFTSPSRLYADGDTFTSSLACSPPSSIATCRA